VLGVSFGIVGAGFGGLAGQRVLGEGKSLAQLLFALTPLRAEVWVSPVL